MIEGVVMERVREGVSGEGGNDGRRGRKRERGVVGGREGEREGRWELQREGWGAHISR